VLEIFKAVDDALSMFRCERKRFNTNESVSVYNKISYMWLGT